MSSTPNNFVTSFSLRLSLCCCYAFLSSIFFLLVFPFLLCYDEYSVTHFFWASARLMSWPDWLCCFGHLQSLVISFLLCSVICSLGVGSVMSYPNFFTHWSPQHPLKNLLFLLRSQCLFCLCYNGLNLLLTLMCLEF